jgi:hypothetical protein
MAEDEGTDRSADEADEEDAEGFQHPDDGIRLREEQLAEHQRRDGAVEQEVVSLDGGADGAGDNGATKLRPVFGFGKPARCHGSGC